MVALLALVSLVNIGAVVPPVTANDGGDNAELVPLVDPVLFQKYWSEKLRLANGGGARHHNGGGGRDHNSNKFGGAQFASSFEQAQRRQHGGQRVPPLPRPATPEQAHARRRPAAPPSPTRSTRAAGPQQGCRDVVQSHRDVPQRCPCRLTQWATVRPTRRLQESTQMETRTVSSTTSPPRERPQNVALNRAWMEFGLFTTAVLPRASRVGLLKLPERSRRRRDGRCRGSIVSTSVARRPRCRAALVTGRLRVRSRGLACWYGRRLTCVRVGGRYACRPCTHRR